MTENTKVRETLQTRKKMKGILSPKKTRLNINFEDDTNFDKGKIVKKKEKKIKDEPKLKRIKRTHSLEENETDSEGTNFDKGKLVKKEKEGKIKDEPKPKRIKRTFSSEGNETVAESLWKDYELLSEFKNIDLVVSKNIINLFEDGNTIPFIARYRKDQTDNMTPNDLRDVKVSYDKILALKARSQAVLKSIEKTGQLDVKLKMLILSAKTIEEIEHIYAPFKPGGKRSLAERAKEIGLDEPALSLLDNTKPVNLNKYVILTNTNADSYEKIEKGIIHLIAHYMSTDTDMLALLRKLRSEITFRIEVKKMIKKASAEKSNKSNIGKPVDETKYENYFDFKIPLQFIKPHQVLAINRGESQKVLSVKIIVPDIMFNKFKQFCTNKWINKVPYDENRKRILHESVKDSYTRILQPLIVREIRSELKTKAELSSCDVFCTNLKQLLLAAPIKGRPILGMDPGFKNGCKVALVSSSGILLESDILYPYKNKSSVTVLHKLLQKHNCSLIALGNGTACRETEAWLSDLIKNNIFSPIDVTYTIVNENGASIYSCSDEAKKEFPSLDPNIISAVSLARRIQEPIAELVKVEPKHLGVGMYQHDLPKKQLEEALDEVVSECVSFVGVNLNTASQCLLRRVAGLTDRRATHIVEYREKSGPFSNRNELLKIKGIGPTVFKQCAGFLRIGPLTIDEVKDFYKKPNTNKLDFTIIHPESYKIALKLLKHLKLKLNDLGEESFINIVKNNANFLDLKGISESFDTTVQTITLIIDALSKPLEHDLRNECPKEPLFKKGLTNLCDLKIGSVLTGSVSNVTHFGCFVDIGVGCDGLIHISKMKEVNLQIGNRVEVSVLNIEINRKRIGLELIRLV